MKTPLPASTSFAYVPISDAAMQEPGTADLTAWVDFSALRHAVHDRRVVARVHGPIQQGHFLLANGIEQRVDALLQVRNMHVSSFLYGRHRGRASFSVI